jgi:putative serine protease PepD
MARALAAVAVLVATALIAFLVATQLGRIDTASLRHVTPPVAATPTPRSTPLTDVGRAALSRVVTIEAVLPNAEALGTGWLFDTRGDFVTNAHVVTGQLSVRLTDRQAHVHVGVVVGTDPAADIAVVRSMDGFALTPLPVDRAQLTTVPLGVIALASSRATGQVDLTSDEITQLHQEVPLSSAEQSPTAGAPSVYHDMLRLEGARVYQGNSGGPVIDSSGEVVGIVTLADPVQPEAYAIPIARVLAELAALAARGG